MRNFFLLILFCIIVPNFHAQEITKQTTLYYGAMENQIGIDKGAGEHWKPLFFDISPEGFIHIPDFYKQRIAVFDFSGKLTTSISVHQGITPRMNYFSLTPAGLYVSFSDHTLYTITTQGELHWKYPLGLGFIPQSLFANELAIFLVPSGADQRAIVFDYQNSTPLGLSGLVHEKQGIPIIQTTKNKAFTLNLEQMKLLPESPINPAGLNLQARAYLLKVDSTSQSYWKSKDGKSEQILAFDSFGEKIKSWHINYPDSQTNGNGFWTVIHKDRLYKNYFFEDKMLIAEYKLD